VIRTDGSLGWIYSRAIPIFTVPDEILEWFGSASDVTQRKQAEEALREQQERAEFVADASDVGFWFCDLPFDKLAWDKRVKNHFWLPPDAGVTIHTFYERLHPEDREPTRRAMERSIANNTQYDVEHRTVAPDGRQNWIRALGRTFYDAAGQPTRFDGVTLNVTDRKQSELALSASEAPLSRAGRGPRSAGAGPHSGAAVRQSRNTADVGKPEDALDSHDDGAGRGAQADCTRPA